MNEQKKVDFTLEEGVARLHKNLIDTGKQMDEANVVLGEQDERLAAIGEDLDSIDANAKESEKKMKVELQRRKCKLFVAVAVGILLLFFDLVLLAIIFKSAFKKR